MLEKIVVVDDDLKVVMLLDKILTNLDFTVISTDNGINALEYLKRERPVRLISDLLLLGLHGAERYQRIKNDPEICHTRIIFMTSVYKESSFKLEMDINANGFITKPFDIPTLSNLVLKTIAAPPCQ